MLADDLPSDGSVAMTPSTWLPRLKELLAFALVRNIGKMLSGNLAGNALNLVAMALMGRALGPEAFGFFMALQAMMLLVAQLSDFGLNTTMVKYYRERLTGDAPGEAEAILRISLWLRLAAVGLMAGACVLLARGLARHLFAEADPADAVRLIRWTCLGAVGSCLWAFCQGALQARQQFGWYAVLTTANHGLRLALVAAWIFLIGLDVPAAVGIMIAIPFMGTMSAALLWPRSFWSAGMPAASVRAQMATILHFSKWIFLSTITTSLIMRLDIFLLTLLSDKGEVGQFAMAERLAQIFPQITFAISAVLLPRLVVTRERAEMLRIIGIYRRTIPWLALGTLAVMALAHGLVPRVLGAVYEPSVWVFDAVVVGYAISLVVSPLSFFCLAFDRAWWLTAMNLGQLILNALMGWWMIPVIGAMGAALASVGVRLFALVFLAVAFRRLLAWADRN